MHVGYRIYFISMLVVLAGFMPEAGADSWQGNLKGGGVVRVDPYTRKPTVYYRGGSTQLWDGAHEMEDGTVVIVRDGVAVPDETMIDTWSHEAPRQLDQQLAVCEKLVRKVCGFHSECAGVQPCYMAQQLRRLEQEEGQWLTGGQTPPSTHECQKGLADPALFPACDKAAGDKVTPCIKLVVKVCGDQSQCNDAPACDPARQLLVMERQERLNSKDPEAITEAGLQCREAMRNAFFKACK
jgi:hypothetical protein